MRFKRNLVFTALVLVLALVVAACGGKKADNTSASNNAASNNQVATNNNATNNTGSTSTDSSSASGTSGATDAAPQTILISMEMVAYSPKEVVIPPGTTVRWVNNDAMDHDVVQGTRDELQAFVSGGGFEPLFQSPVMKQGDVWEYTFTEEGEYAYGCTQGWHFMGGMLGTITVKAGAEVPQELVI